MLAVLKDVGRRSVEVIGKSKVAGGTWQMGELKEEHCGLGLKFRGGDHPRGRYDLRCR
jgi:hypothetical protein